MGSAVVWVTVLGASIGNVLILGGWALVRLGRLATARGYPGPALPALVATVGAVEGIVGPRLLAGDQWSIQPVHYVLVGGLMDATMAVGFLVVLALPRRPTRHGGRRRSRLPFVWLGRLLVVGAVVLLPVSQRLDMQQGMGQVAMLLVGLSVACHRAAARQRQPSAEEVQAADHRPPVVFLRPFAHDREVFVLLDRPPKPPLWRRPAVWLYRGMPLVDPDEDRKLTFEAFLADDVGRELGPLTALGDPSDYLAPLGAARLYADDEEWRRHAAALIDRARCLLTVPCAPTGALAWELDHVRRSGAVTRLFVIDSPSGVHSQVWSAFTAALSSLGYTAFAGPPAPGAVLAFDRSAQMHELTTGAWSPADYVRALGPVTGPTMASPELVRRR